jgi:hypothetical protein
MKDEGWNSKEWGEISSGDVTDSLVTQVKRYAFSTEKYIYIFF